MKKFLIVGLPRSGTTYLFTLLNSHPKVLCHGERFNPMEIIENRDGEEVFERDREKIILRDSKPLAFFNAGFEQEPFGYSGKTAVGYKYMLGHNPRILSEAIPQNPDVAIIYVHRENKLAQVASLAHAQATSTWAQREKGAPLPPLELWPLQMIGQIHEFGTRDYLFGEWLKHLPNAVLSVEYREMFRPGFEDQLCGFLGISPDPAMAPQLAKQGSNHVLERFAHKDAIRGYFTRTGHADWLGEEI